MHPSGEILQRRGRNKEVAEVSIERRQLGRDTTRVLVALLDLSET